MIIPTPRAFVVAAGFAALTALAGVWPAALWLSILLLAAWVVLVLADGQRAGGVELDVERVAPAAFSVGRELPVDYRWTLGGARRQHIEVRERWASALTPSAEPRILDLAPGETREHLMARATRRGVAAGGAISVRRLGPLGLTWWQQSFARPWNVTVFPSLASVAHRGLSVDARRRVAGLRAVRARGEGRLFETLREWVPGDEPRIIDWKATARRGKPMARVYEDERRQQVLMLLDAGRLLTSESDGVARLEAAIDGALQLAYAASEHDDDVGILVFADTVQAFVPPMRGRRGLRAVLAALATVEGRVVESNYPAAFRHVALHHRRRALTVLFSDVIDRTASAALLTQASTLRPRHLPLAVLLRDPAVEKLATTVPTQPREAFERAAAEELLEERDAALTAMRRQGVIVLDVRPEGAADAVVAGYERLKRRGVL